LLKSPPSKIVSHQNSSNSQCGGMRASGRIRKAWYGDSLLIFFNELRSGWVTRYNEIQISVQQTIIKVWVVCLLAVFTTLISACQPQEAKSEPTEGFYRPPTQIPGLLSSTAIFLEDDQKNGEEIQRSTPTPTCTDDLWFLQDITIPDGTVVEPGESIDKRWQVRNSGNCNWDENYSIKLVAGPGMGVPVQQALIPARSGTDVILRMIFSAPEEPGNYRSVWQAHDRHGNPFGNSFFIDIIVAGSETQPAG